MSTVRANNYYDASGGSNAQLYGVASPPNSMGFRNRILNGDCRIDQRNAGASLSPATAAQVYSLDRWGVQQELSAFTVQQNAGGVTPPAGFRNYLGITVTTQRTVGAASYYTINQYIEGFNTADLNWGTANAQPVTVSFWVRSSLTGTFSVAVNNAAANRAYPTTYTINAANTWEFKTVTIPGDTTGTWETGNLAGIRLWFGLGWGSSYSAAAGAWTGTGGIYAATGATSVVGTNGATFYITGVQLEAGTVASPFERRDYGRELMMCQRYLYRIPASSSYTRFGVTENEATISAVAITYPPVSMRATPSLTTTGTLSNYGVYSGGGVVALTSLAIEGSSSPSLLVLVCGVASGLTVGRAGNLLANNSSSAFLQFSAEL